MSPTTYKNIIDALAILCLVYEIQRSRGQLYNTRLCGSLSKMATRQRLRFCQESGNNLEVVRIKRDVNTTQQTIKSTTHRQIATTKRPSYQCKGFGTSPNGFPPGGLDLTIKCAKVGNWFSADITWQIPKPQSGRSDCEGYWIIWKLLSAGIHYCDYITEKNRTSYFMDSSKGWKRLDNGDERLYIAVFPLPQSSFKGTIDYHEFHPTGCSDPGKNTTTTSPPDDGAGKNKDPAKTTTTSPPLKTTERTRILPGITTLPSKDAAVKNTGPMVNKLVFSLVIASIAVVILAIIFVLCRKKPVIPDRKSNKTPEGAPHYISYNASNKGEALDIARWLQEKNINVIIDQLSYIKPNRRAWSERQLLEAEKIIMIVTPKYLGICNLQQTKSNEEKKRSHNDELVCNEIALIKNKLIEMGMAADKCIVILIDTQRKDLPHWMSQFNCYQYKNGKLSEGILPMLKPVISLNTLL